MQVGKLSYNDALFMNVSVCVCARACLLNITVLEVWADIIDLPT